MNFIRKYFLAAEDGGIAWDKHFSLVFSADGQMFVQVLKIYEQAYRAEEINDIPPAEFYRFNLNGVPLGDLVAKKLDEILPP